MRLAQVIIRRRFALIIAGALLLALIARLATYRQYLPFMEHRLEGNMFLLAQSWRGFGVDSLYGTSVVITQEWLTGYPPLFVWLSVIHQTLLENLTTRPWLLVPDYIATLRLLSVGVGVLTTGCVLALGWLLAGWAAGFLAGIGWALSPLVLRENSLATPDPYVYLLATLTLVLIVLAHRRASPRWAFVSLITLILAIYTKYQVAALVIPYGLLLLSLLRTYPQKIRRWLPLHIVVAIVGAGWLLLIYGAVGLSNAEGEGFRDGGWQLMLSPTHNLHNWTYALLPLGGWLAGLLVALAGGLAYSINRRRGGRTLNTPGVLLCLSFTIGTVMLVTGIFSVNLDAMRHVLPASAILMAVGAALVTQVIWTAQAVLHGAAIRRALEVLPAALIIAALIILGIRAIHLSADYARPHSVVQLWRYADANLPLDGAMLLRQTSALHNLWNRPYQGYDGAAPFTWVWDDQPQAQSPQDFARVGVTYYIQTSVEGHSTRELDAFIAQLMPVKQFPRPGADVAGPQVNIYRMLPPQKRVEADFGGQIMLYGYDLNHAAAPGATLTLRPYWRILNPPANNYNIFLHLYPAEDTTALLAQADGAPAAESYPTLLWDDPAETIIGREQRLTLPDDLPPGEYQLALGLYDWATLERLPVQAETGQADTLTLLRFTIVG